MRGVARSRGRRQKTNAIDRYQNRDQRCAFARGDRPGVSPPAPLGNTMLVPCMGCKGRGGRNMSSARGEQVLLTKTNAKKKKCSKCIFRSMLCIRAYLSTSPSPPPSSSSSMFTPLLLPLGLLLARFLEHKVEPAPPLHVEREEVVIEDRP